MLCEALNKTFANWEHQFTLEQFEQIMTFDNDDEMQKKWMSFTKKMDVGLDDIPEILQNINEFLLEPYTAVMDRQLFEKQWNVNAGNWNKKLMNKLKWRIKWTTWLKGLD